MTLKEAEAYFGKHARYFPKGVRGSQPVYALRYGGKFFTAADTAELMDKFWRHLQTEVTTQ